MQAGRFAAVLLTVGALAGASLVATGPAAAVVTVDLYASPAGSGTTCSLAAPCSLSAAQTKVQGLTEAAIGDIAVNLLGGTYALTAPLTFGPDDSGLKGYDVIWRAAPGAAPVLSGAKAVTGWTQVGSTGVWKAARPAGVTDTRQLYVNNERAVRAKGRYLPPGFTKDAAFGYTTTPAASLDGWKNPSSIEFVYQHSYIQQRCPVASVVGNTVTMANPCWTNANGHPGLTNGWGLHNSPNYIENAFELLDQPGEWYLDQTGAVAGDTTPTVYYKPRAGESLTGTGAVQVTVPAVEKLLVVSGIDAGERVEHLQIIGLTFADATWLEPNTAEGFVALQANFRMAGPYGHYLDYSGWAKNPSAVVLSFAQDVRLERNTVTRVGSVGINVEDSSNNITLLGNHILGVSGSGIQIGGISLQDQRPGAFKQTEHVTSTAGDYFTYPFSGTGIDLLSTKGPDRGTADVYVDDVFVQSVDCNADGIRRQQYCARIRGLATGSHTVKVVKTGTGSFGLDGFRGFPAFTVADDTHASITYSGSWSAQTGLTVPAERMHDITVQSNHVHDVGVEFKSAIGIWAGFVDTLTVRNNEVANVPYTGISAGWGWGYLDQGGAGDWGAQTTPTVAQNNLIGGNYVHHHLISGEDGGAIYLLGDQPNSVEKENFISNSGESGSQRGIYLDNGTQHWEVYNNVVDRTSSWILLSDNFSPPYALNNTVRDNWSNTNGGDLCNRPENTCTNNIATIVDQDWPAAAQAVIDNAGLEPAYKYLHGTASTKNLAIGASAVASNIYSGGYPASAAIDGKILTRWATSAATTAATLDVTFPQSTTVNRVVLREAQYGTGHVDGYTIEYWDGTAWVVAASRPQPGVVDDIRFPEVTSTKLRLSVTSASGGPTVQELEAYHDKNVAQGKTASQSSTWVAPASLAVDGNTDGNHFNGSVSHTYSNTNAWWQVDLGAQHTISGVNIFNRTDGHSDRLSDYWVFVSQTPFSTALTPSQQEQVTGVKSLHQTSQAGSPTTLSLENAVGRYLMVQLAGTNYLSLAEVQAFGTPLPPPFAGTGFEAGNPQPSWVNTAETNGVMNIVGSYPGVPVPFADLRSGEHQHGGSWSLAYAGKGTSSSGPNYSYAKVFDLTGSPTVLGASSSLSYWIYPNSSADPAVVGNNSTCVALDLVFTDGSRLKDSTAVDQDGNSIHPASQCGELTTDAWNQVTVILGSLQGKTVSRVLLGYDHPNVTGGFHGWVDDIAITY